MSGSIKFSHVFILFAELHLVCICNFMSFYDSLNKNKKEIKTKYDKLFILSFCQCRCTSKPVIDDMIRYSSFMTKKKTFTFMSVYFTKWRRINDEVPESWMSRILFDILFNIVIRVCVCICETTTIFKSPYISLMSFSLVFWLIFSKMNEF